MVFEDIHPEQANNMVHTCFPGTSNSILSKKVWGGDRALPRCQMEKEVKRLCGCFLFGWFVFSLC